MVLVGAWPAARVAWWIKIGSEVYAYACAQIRPGPASGPGLDFIRKIGP